MYTAGYWLAVVLILGAAAATVFALAYLAYRARRARETFVAKSKSGDAQKDIQAGNDLVLQYAELRREAEREMAAGRERLEGMKGAFEKGLKG